MSEYQTVDVPLDMISQDFETSEHIGELIKALSKCQGEMRVAEKSQANPFHKSKYADLVEVWEVARPVLSSNGLAVIQSPSMKNGYLNMTTMLAHTSGQWFRGVLSCKCKSELAQDVGAAVTYMRRYGMMAMIGCVAALEDDDGNSAHGRDHKEEKPQYQRPQPQQQKIESYDPANASHKIELMKLFKKLGFNNLDQLKKISEELKGEQLDRVEYILSHTYKPEPNTPIVDGL